MCVCVCVCVCALQFSHPNVEALFIHTKAHRLPNLWTKKLSNRSRFIKLKVSRGKQSKLLLLTT
jgi:hypothetical protein